MQLTKISEDLQDEEFNRANGSLRGMVDKFLKATTTNRENLAGLKIMTLKRMIYDHFTDNAANNLSVLQGETIFNIL